MALTAQFVEGPLSADQLNTSSVPVVTTTADIVAPFDRQLVVNSSDNILYRYEGGAWIGAVALGGFLPSTMHEARYEQRSSPQTISNSTDTKLKFEFASYPCDDVTPSGTGNTDFLLNRFGVWQVSVATRLLGNAGSGERHLAVHSGSTFNFGLRFAAHVQANVGSAPVTLTCSTEARLLAGTVITVWCWHNAGSGVTVDTGWGSTNHLALTWLRS